jgi:nicotinamidase-related amidase
MMNTPVSGAGLCVQSRSQLLVVDIQEKLAAAMPEKVVNRVLRNATVLLKAAGLLQIPTLVTEQYPRGLGSTHPGVMAAVARDFKRFEKTCFSCLGAEGIDTALADPKRRQIIVAGMEAHVCVLQTAFDLRAAGLDVLVVDDAICSRRLENYQNAIDRLRQTGITVTNTESVVFEWLRDARHEHFKTISAWVR